MDIQVLRQHLIEHHGFPAEGEWRDVYMVNYHQRMHDDETAYNLDHMHNEDGATILFSPKEIARRRHPHHRARSTRSDPPDHQQ